MTDSSIADRVAMRTIKSEILGENRRYWVYVPRGYNDPESADKRYPVVVHLDGNCHGFWSPTVAEYMIHHRRMPPAVVVGVWNRDEAEGLTGVERARDLTPTHSLLHFDGKPNEGYRLSGGADRFLRFLEDELLVSIESEFRTLPKRAIVGQSLAGCFVLDAYLRGLSRFQGYVALDPCLWWDDWRATGIRDSLETGSGIFERALFLAFSGTDEPNRLNQVDWFERLAEKAGDELRRHLRFAHYAEESHGSMNLKGVYEGLSFVFGKVSSLDWGVAK